MRRQINAIRSNGAFDSVERRQSDHHAVGQLLEIVEPASRRVRDDSTRPPGKVPSE
jgi:hypothetical protein